MAKTLLTPLIIAAALALTACSTPEPPEQVERPASILYDEALVLAAGGDNKDKKEVLQVGVILERYPLNVLILLVQGTTI